MPFGQHKTYIEVGYKEVNELIKAEYGRDYDCVVDHEWQNDEYHSFEVEDKPLDAFESETIELFRTGESAECYTLDLLLRDLAARKVIESGDYLIKVWW